MPLTAQAHACLPIQIFLDKFHNHCPFFRWFCPTLTGGPLGMNELHLVTNKNFKVASETRVLQSNHLDFIGKGLFPKELFQREKLPLVAYNNIETKDNIVSRSCDIEATLNGARRLQTCFSFVTLLAVAAMATFMLYSRQFDSFQLFSTQLKSTHLIRHNIALVLWLPYLNSAVPDFAFVPWGCCGWKKKGCLCTKLLGNIFDCVPVTTSSDWPVGGANMCIESQ